MKTHQGRKNEEKKDIAPGRGGVMGLTDRAEIFDKTNGEIFIDFS